jgi:hypothetical protein
MQAEEIREVFDDFGVEGSRKSGSQLVGTQTSVGGGTWVSSATCGKRSFEFSDIFDMVKNGQVRVPQGSLAVANGVGVPKMANTDQLVVDYEITLNKASFASIFISGDGDILEGKALLFKAQIEQNGNVMMSYPGGKVEIKDGKRPWWLRKDQPIQLKLAYNASSRTVGFAIHGISSVPDDPTRPNTVVVARNLPVPDELYKNIASAGMFVNGDSARMDNFHIVVQKANADALGIKEEKDPTIIDGKITVTVEKGARQTFEGFGANLMGGPDFDRMSAENHAQLAKALWTDLRFNSVRLWHWTWHKRLQISPDIKSFRERYVGNGMISHAQKAGMNCILLSGDGIPPQMTSKDEKGKLIVRSESLNDYVAILAELILRARMDDNIKINYVGLQNEPGANNPFRPEDFPPAVKYLRKALDKRGLSDVKIIAPESSGVSGNFFKTLDLLQEDKEAWEAIDVIAAHSYDMAANERLENIIQKTGKAFWMTEASNAPPDDSRAASTVTGLCLNDLNHLVNRWMWFIGYSHYTPTSDGGGTGPRMIQFWNNKGKTFRYECLLKYYYFQALSHTFDVGAVFRKSISLNEGRMTWPSKTKPPPRVTLASARNPDGSWGIAALNYTTGPHTPPDINPEWKWPRSPGHPEEEFEVTVVIEELADKDNVRFVLKECSDTLKNVKMGEVSMKKGSLTFKIKPMHLIVLRSGPKL